MENKNNKSMKREIAILVLGIVLLNLVFVSGLSIGFGSAVSIEPGQSVEKSFTLMNKATNTTNLIVEMKVEQGSEYVTFSEGTRYEVPAGGIKSVPAVFKVPTNAKPGDVYPVKINFNSIGGGVAQSGTVEFNVGYTLSFDINVMKEIPTTGGKTTAETPSSINSTWLIVGIIAIIIVIAIIWFVMKKKNE